MTSWSDPQIIVAIGTASAALLVSLLTLAWSFRSWKRTGPIVKVEGRLKEVADYIAPTRFYFIARNEGRTPTQIVDFYFRQGRKKIRPFWGRDDLPLVLDPGAEGWLNVTPDSIVASAERDGVKLTRVVPRVRTGHGEVRVKVSRSGRKKLAAYFRKRFSEEKRPAGVDNSGT